MVCSLDPLLPSIALPHTITLPHSGTADVQRLLRYSGHFQSRYNITIIIYCLHYLLPLSVTKVCNMKGLSDSQLSKLSVLARSSERLVIRQQIIIRLL